MKNQIIRINNFIQTIGDGDVFDTDFVVKNQLFLKERKKGIVGGHSIFYYVVKRGLLKVKKEIPIGVSKRAVYKIKGSDLKKALKIYYNL